MPSRKSKTGTAGIKPRVVAVRFTQAQFMTLPPPERELLIRLGLAQNDLLLIQRLWGALYYRKPKSQLAREVQAIHQVALLLILLGKLFEALRIFDHRFLRQSRLRVEYHGRFKPEQVAAVAQLKTLLGRSQLLSTIRNSFAFHYHDADLSGFIKELPADRLLAMYFGEPDANSMNSFAAEPFLLSFMRTSRKDTPDAALRYVQREAFIVLKAFNTFVSAVQLSALHKMFGQMPVPEECKILPSEFLPHDKFKVPFLMGIATSYKPKRATRRQS